MDIPSSLPNDMANLKNNIGIPQEPPPEPMVKHSPFSNHWQHLSGSKRIYFLAFFSFIILLPAVAWGATQQTRLRSRAAGYNVTNNPEATDNSTVDASTCTPQLLSPPKDAVVKTSPLLSWSACSGQNLYRYQVYIIGEKVYQITPPLKDTIFSLRLINMQPGSLYTWKVRSCTLWSESNCEGGYSLWSPEYTFWWKSGGN